MRLVQLPVTYSLLLWLALLVPCLSVTFEDGTSGDRTEARGNLSHIRNNAYSEPSTFARNRFLKLCANIECSKVEKKKTMF